MKSFLVQLAAGSPLSEAQALEAFSQVMGGGADPVQTAALLALMGARLPTADEMVGAVRAMRARMVRVEVPAGKVAVDIVGTGGDHAGTFNVSTAAALAAAAAGRDRGLVVAKHGNRSVTSTSGSSQALEALGVTLTGEPAQLTACMERAGIAFLFAPNHHPAMKHAAPIRAALGFRTIFNVLGPLTNPTGASRQVVGVFDRALMPVMAEALRRLGSEKAWVVNGQLTPNQALDELSPLGESQVLRVLPAGITSAVVSPGSLGLQGGAMANLQTADPQESAALIRRIFAGEERGVAREAVALNAAAVLVVAGLADDLSQGLAQVGPVLDNGQAAQVLAELVAVSG